MNENVFVRAERALENEWKRIHEHEILTDTSLTDQQMNRRLVQAVLKELLKPNAAMDEQTRLRAAFLDGAKAMRDAFLTAVLPEAQDLDNRRSNDPTGYLSGNWQGIRWACDRIRAVKVTPFPHVASTFEEGEGR